jgi:integrase
MAEAPPRDKQPSWIRTRVQHLYLHRDSGRYYVRAFRQGKEIWKSLKTTSAEVARAQAPKVLQKPTVGQAADLYRAKVETDVEIKDSSKKYRYETIEALFRSWPGLRESRLSSVTVAQCREWAEGFLKAKRATGHNWKGEAKRTMSASRFNNTVDTLRHIFGIGIEHGIILSNPADSIGKVTPKQKPIRIRNRESFTALISEIRNAKGAVSHCSADLVEFLAYSGCCIDESRWVKWPDIDRSRRQIFVSGHEHTGTKRGDGRWIPIIPPMERLLDDLRANPTPRSAKRRQGGYVLAVRECQKAIDRACQRLNISRFSHHDLRHLFATRAIESGVDIPTVSRWLGHRDGGSLAMRTYGHLRDEHSQMMASKVTF